MILSLSGYITWTQMYLEWPFVQPPHYERPPTPPPPRSLASLNRTQHKTRRYDVMHVQPSLLQGSQTVHYGAIELSGFMRDTSVSVVGREILKQLSQLYQPNTAVPRRRDWRNSDVKIKWCECTHSNILFKDSSEPTPCFCPSFYFCQFF